MQQKRIIVAGTGFAGLWSALAAVRLINKSAKEQQNAPHVEVVVVSPQPSLVLRPRLYEADPASKVVQLGDLLIAAGIRHVQGLVDTIRAAEHEIDVVDAAGARSVLSYDRFILATGSSLVRPKIPGIFDHAFSVDQVEDAIQLEAHLQGLASLSSSPSRNTVVVCGDGFTGIELAADLPARLSKILGSDAAVRVILVGRENEIGESLGPGPRPVIVHALTSLGIDIRLGAAVTAIDANGVQLSNGERIETLTAIWTAGVVATPLTQQIPGVKDGYGRLHVNPDLRTLGDKDVFATGDAAFAATDDCGNHAMMSCQHAIQLGRSAGHNAAADLLSLPTIPYSQPAYGTCLDLGTYGAVIAEGWNRKVVARGLEAKKIKQQINNVLIYPPVVPEEAIFAADPLAEPASVEM